MSKLCGECRQVKRLSEFGTDPWRKDGYNRRCRSCHREYTRLAKQRERERKGSDVVRAEWRAWYANNREYRAAYQQVSMGSRAGQILANAVVAGKVVRPAICSNCSVAVRVQAHHDDYAKPLDVDWLCASCHSLLHLIARRL